MLLNVRARSVFEHLVRQRLIVQKLRFLHDEIPDCITHCNVAQVAKKAEH